MSTLPTWHLFSAVTNARIEGAPPTLPTITHEQTPAGLERQLVHLVLVVCHGSQSCLLWLPWQTTAVPKGSFLSNQAFVCSFPLRLPWHPMAPSSWQTKRAWLPRRGGRGPSCLVRRTRAVEGADCFSAAARRLGQWSRCHVVKRKFTSEANNIVPRQSAQACATLGD